MQARKRPRGSSFPRRAPGRQSWKSPAINPTCASRPHHLSAWRKNLKSEAYQPSSPANVKSPSPSTEHLMRLGATDNKSTANAANSANAWPDYPQRTVCTNREGHIAFTVFLNKDAVFCVFPFPLPFFISIFAKVSHLHQICRAQPSKVRGNIMIARSFTTGTGTLRRTMTVSKNVLMALLILSYATWGGGDRHEIRVRVIYRHAGSLPAWRSPGSSIWRCTACGAYPLSKGD